LHSAGRLCRFPGAIPLSWADYYRRPPAKSNRDASEQECFVATKSRMVAQRKLRGL